ncbi:MarR family winged helix-turn-helix transcriptional regulator [Vibrio gigantis]|uniref:MarR family transcriptional regulator n=1 Tax=Vibrio gigantis TaxID=296199 RepID=A0A5M9P550_9VIBR|nr:MarR family transcriptional regulator [Vibrio gigantis]KAA8681266.1 MarR family transcriptional regulator [Vibrio gigantis]
MANKQAIINSDLDVSQKVIGLIACIGQEMKSEMTRKLKPTGLSLIQLEILHVLSKAPEKYLTVNQIKKLMTDESPNVSRALNKLMDAALIEKRRDSQDQRVVYIHITEVGEQAHIDADQQLLSVSLDFSPGDAEKLYELLKKL